MAPTGFCDPAPFSTPMFPGGDAVYGRRRVNPMNIRFTLIAQNWLPRSVRTCVRYAKECSMNNSALQREEILFRPPVIGDGTAIYELIRQSPPLDLNSRYLYLLLCDHFSESCIIAESESRTVGFISAYGHPKKQETLFVWQVAVARDSVNDDWHEVGKQGM